MKVNKQNGRMANSTHGYNTLELGPLTPFWASVLVSPQEEG